MASAWAGARVRSSRAARCARCRPPHLLGRLPLPPRALTRASPQFPTIKFFPAGAGKPEDLVEDYTGGREGQDFVTFLNERSGAERTLEGGVTARAGRIASFDALAARFAGAADAAERAAVLALARSAQAKLEGAALQAKAEVYVRSMAKASEPGKEGYAAKEAARVQGMLASEGVTKAKKTELAMKLNVLKAFTEPAAGAADDEAEL